MQCIEHVAAHGSQSLGYKSPKMLRFYLLKSLSKTLPGLCFCIGKVSDFQSSAQGDKHILLFVCF